MGKSTVTATKKLAVHSIEVVSLEHLLELRSNPKSTSGVVRPRPTQDNP